MIHPEQSPPASFPPSISHEYDAVIVGAGATGGVAAHELGRRGLKVLVLDAGPQLSPEEALGNVVTNMAQRLVKVVSRQQSFQALHPGYWKTNPELFVDERQNPYTTPSDLPFFWTRGRQVGGRSLTWGGCTLRLSDFEFKPASRDGYGDDWPIQYRDLAPYYDYLEQFLQIKGNRDGLPQLPDGFYTGAAKFTPAEAHFRNVLGDRRPELPMIISRGFPLHRSHGHPQWAPSSSLGSTLKAALATGNVTVQPNAVVSHIFFNPTNHQAQGVEYVHRLQKTTHGVKARTIVLCASTIESIRILLHSTEDYQPGGLVNPSGLLGRHLMDHMSTMTFFTLPDFIQPNPPFDLSGCDSFFIPRVVNLHTPHPDFLRGYGLWGGIQRFGVPSLLRNFGNRALGFFIGYGEVLPRVDNYLELNPHVSDAWGIPVPHIHMSWSDNEQRMIQHMQTQIQEMVELMGGQCIRLTELVRSPFYPERIRQLESQVMDAAPPGYYIHEVGGAPMGTSPRNSVVNPFNQLWESPNILVVDGACWTTAGWQNPTLTEMAITARACDYLVNPWKKYS